MEQDRAAQGVRRQDPRSGGQHLEPLAGAELASDRARRDCGHDRHQRAEQAQADERRPDRRVDEARGERGQRREVDVAEGEVPARGEEVELVPIPPVTAEDRHEQGDLRKSEQHAEAARSGDGIRGLCAMHGPKIATARGPSAARARRA